MSRASCRSQGGGHLSGAGASTFVVIAAYNEASVIGSVLDDLVTTCPEACVVIVDDGSSDGTFEVASGYPVRVLRHAVNRGQGAALATGFAYALARDAEIVVTFDADGQMAASDIARICEPISSGEAEVVLGTRSAARSTGMPVSRFLTLRLGTTFTRVTSGLPVTDTYNGLRAFSRTAAERIHIRQDRMGHGLESSTRSPTRASAGRRCPSPSATPSTPAPKAFPRWPRWISSPTSWLPADDDHQADSRDRRPGVDAGVPAGPPFLAARPADPRSSVRAGAAGGHRPRHHHLGRPPAGRQPGVRPALLPGLSPGLLRHRDPAHPGPGTAGGDHHPRPRAGLLGARLDEVGATATEQARIPGSTGQVSRTSPGSTGREPPEKAVNGAGGA